MPSPVDTQPGLLIRDSFKFSDSILIVPPPLVQYLAFFDAAHSEAELQAALTAAFQGSDVEGVAGQLHEALSKAGFLDDEVYAALRQQRLSAFTASPVRAAAHAGSAYPADLAALQEAMGRYMGPAAAGEKGLIGIAAPHISPEGGWQCYRAAYQTLTPALSDRTFVVLGTSHYGQPDKFGLTRKPFETPYGIASIDEKLVNELAAQPAAVMEDYCHAVEHSIEFQVLFLQSIYGPEVRILPILCGSFGLHLEEGKFPEDDAGVGQFLQALERIAAREGDRLFWVLGVDMAHMGVRYGDHFAANADQAEMAAVRERDQHRIESVKACDAHGFWNLVRENNEDLKWCGSSPFYTFMRAVPQAKGFLRRYEQWNIDPQSVVSFAGISFSA